MKLKKLINSLQEIENAAVKAKVNSLKFWGPHKEFRTYFL